MPAAIPAAATAFASWVSGAVYAGATGLGLSAATASTLSIYATAFAYASVGYAAQAAVVVGLGAMAQAQVPDVETGKITRKQTRPLRTNMVGGPSRVSGAYMLRESKGNKLGIVVACCEGRLGSVSQVYLNDDKVTLSGGYVQGMANERYGTGDLVRLEYRLGLPTETHYGFLTADFGSYWPTTARGDGIASIGLLAQHRSTESFPRHFPNGEPIPSMAATPVCYDWRDETQDREDQATWKECWNPVVWLVHVEWTRHGRSWARCVAPVLDDLTDEADYCDVTVDGEARYRVAGNYPANLTPDAVRGNILAAMDGWMSVNGKGQLVVKAGRYVEPDFTLTGEHIVAYSWRSFQVAEEAVTELVVSYVSAEHDYSEVEAGTYSKDEPSPVGRSETLQLPWVPSAKQAMRLARRKMTRLDAERRGTVRSTIYGLNGLGKRFIRVQNPELASMADVVLEVMNVELDLAQGQVVFEVILADTTIDDDETVSPDVPGTPTRPAPERGREDPADRPIGRDTPFPIEATISEITVAEFDVHLRDGSVATVGADTLTGLSASTTYGVFWREDEGLEVEAWPATDHMTTGSWLFLGWQATPDGSGAYPANPDAPAGWGGDGTVKDDLLRYPGGGQYAGALDATKNTGALADKDTVGADEIDDGAVGSGKLADGAVDLASAKVTGKSLANIDSAAATKLGGIQAGATDDSAVVALANDLASGAAKPAEAVTFTGKGDLATKDQADTADIVPLAVNDSEVAFTEATISLLAGSMTEVQSLVITSNGGGIRLDFSAYFSATDTIGINAYVQIKRNGVTIYGPSAEVQGIKNGDGNFIVLTPWVLPLVDFPGAGTHTYSLQIQMPSGSVRDCRRRQIIAQVFKDMT